MIVDGAAEDVRDGVARCVTAAHAMGWVAQQVEASGVLVRDAWCAGALLYGEHSEGGHAPVLRALRSRDGRYLPVVGVQVDVVSAGADVLAGLLGLKRESEVCVSDDGTSRCGYWSGWASQWHDVLVHVLVRGWEQVS